MTEEIIIYKGQTCGPTEINLFKYTARKPCGATFILIDKKSVQNFIKNYPAKIIKVERLTQEEKEVINS